MDNDREYPWPPPAPPRCDTWPAPEDFRDNVEDYPARYPDHKQRTEFVKCVIEHMGEINVDNVGDHPANTSSFSMAKLIFLFDVLGMRSYIDMFFKSMILEEGFTPSDFTKENYKAELEQYDNHNSEAGTFFLFDKSHFEDTFNGLDEDKKNTIIALMLFLQMNIPFTYENIQYLKYNRGNYEKITNYIAKTMSVTPEGGYKKRTKKPKSKKRKQTKTKKSKTKRKKTRRNKRR